MSVLYALVVVLAEVGYVTEGGLWLFPAILLLLASAWLFWEHRATAAR